MVDLFGEALAAVSAETSIGRIVLGIDFAGCPGTDLEAALAVIGIAALGTDNLDTGFGAALGAHCWAAAVGERLAFAASCWCTFLVSSSLIVICNIIN